MVSGASGDKEGGEDVIASLLVTAFICIVFAVMFGIREEEQAQKRFDALKHDGRNHFTCPSCGRWVDMDHWPKACPKATKREVKE
jgi:rubrerythrin